MGAAEVVVGFVGDAGRFTVVVAVDVAVCVAALDCPAAPTFGAANLFSSLVTFVPFWLGFFWWPVAPVVRVVPVPCVFGFDEISSAAICRVTAPIEVILLVERQRERG